MMKGIKGFRQEYKNLSFRKKLFLIFVVICALPIAGFQLVSMQISVSHLSNQVDELITTNLNQTSERFSMTLDAYTDVVYQIYADDSIAQNLVAYQNAGTMEKTALFYDIKEKVKQFAEMKNGIRCISLICPSGDSITYDKQTNSAVDNIWRDYQDIREIEPYRLTSGRQGVRLIPTRLIQDNGDKVALFFLGKDIYSSEDMDRGVIATVIMGISSDVLDDICKNNNADVENVNFITDASATLISFPQEEYLGYTIKDAKDACELVERSEIITGSKKRLTCSWYKDEEYEWTFYNVYDYNSMMRPIIKVQHLYWFLLVMDLVVVILLVMLVSQSFVGYLVKIIDGIHQVENGNFDAQIEVDRKDEFGQIGEHFNVMTKSVKTLMDEVVDISEKKNQAQIKALEAQINPHFLYNTLDAINWMAVEHEEYEISRMLGNLGYILRYTMNQNNVMVKVSEAEEWVKSYVALYQLRYRYAFEFQISVEPEVKSVYIYKLLLQPIIENAILHGIKDVEGGIVRVDISRMEEKDKLYIIVEDNGCGMEADKVAYYNERARQSASGGRIGLTNVFERIALYYGTEGSWHINSVEGMGTTVEILLPLIKKEKEEEGIEVDEPDNKWNGQHENSDC